LPSASASSSASSASSPDVGGGFGYKCVLQAEEVCVAWLALTRRHPVRWIEDAASISSPRQRQGAPHVVTAYADAKGRLLASTARSPSMSAPTLLAVHRLPRGGACRRQFAGPYVSPAYRCRTYSVHQQASFVPYRGVAAGRVLRHGADDRCRCARRSREPWEVRPRTRAGGGDAYDNVTAQAFRQRRLPEEPGAASSASARRDRAASRRRGRLPPHRHRLATYTAMPAAARRRRQSIGRERCRVDDADEAGSMPRSRSHCDSVVSSPWPNDCVPTRISTPSSGVEAHRRLLEAGDQRDAPGGEHLGARAPIAREVAKPCYEAPSPRALWRAADRGEGRWLDRSARLFG